MHTKAILLAILIIFLTACTNNNAVETDAEKITGIATEIADFDLPAGYQADFSASLMGYTVASFRPDDGYSHLYLIQSEKASDGEKLTQMLNDLVPGASDAQTRMTIIETRPITMRGQEETLVISEGINSEGETYRQVSVAFQGKGGPALLVISEPVERWNQELVDAFIASIH